MSNASIRVGTASWSEPEFVKAGWYPKGLAAGQWLAYYAQFFDYVELNSSFYAIPAAKMCEKWVKETPDGFLFDVKCHRLLSRHATKADALPTDLRDEVELTDRENVILTPALEEEVAGRFLEALVPLEKAGQLGALLLQMSEQTKEALISGKSNLPALSGTTEPVPTTEKLLSTERAVQEAREADVAAQKALRESLGYNYAPLPTSSAPPTFPTPFASPSIAPTHVWPTP